MEKLTQAQRLFEISFEVCNKVGGIYTVVSTKAPLLKELYPEFIQIGPYFEQNAKKEFQQMPAPEHIQRAFDSLSGRGVQYYFGKWLIPGEPCAILIDFKGEFNSINEFKKIFWEKFGLDSLSSGFDYDEPLAFSIAAGKLIEAIITNDPSKTSVCHTHEWMTGFAALYLKHRNVRCATIFTTHATMLGRAYCGTGADVYTALPLINPEHEAHRLNVYAKFSAEKTCAKHADCFTTVSAITANEANKILGIEPKVLTLNGINAERYQSFEDVSLMHAQSRERLQEFCMYYFFPYQSFDIDRTLFFYTSGRYEMRNKGIDVTIAALGQLNNKMKAENSKKTIVTFFWVPLGSRGPKLEILENKAHFRHIKNYLDRHHASMQKTVIRKILQEQSFTENHIFDDEFFHTIGKLKSSLGRTGNPPLCAFDMDGGEKDIISMFYQYGLMNNPDDRVKVVLYPVYLNSVDGLLDFNYEEAVAGCHLGLFPSYYEPWGYTPAESVALGIPAITSDLAGFGQYVWSNCGIKSGNACFSETGVFVLERLGKSFEQTAREYANMMHYYASLDRTQRVDQKINAKRFSLQLDWKKLIDRYTQAHNIAVEKSRR